MGKSRFARIKITKKKIPIDRQIQIITGSLVFISVILSFTISNSFLFIAAFIGLGLTYAGISGTCYLGMFLSKAPWNKR